METLRFKHKGNVYTTSKVVAFEIREGFVQNFFRELRIMYDSMKSDVASEFSVTKIEADGENFTEEEKQFLDTKFNEMGYYRV